MVQERRYWDIVKAVATGGEMAERDTVLRSMASECDRLREKIVDDAKELSELWLKVRYQGRGEPTGRSALSLQHRGRRPSRTPLSSARAFACSSMRSTSSTARRE